jgi:hypothetical protein
MSTYKGSDVGCFVYEYLLVICNIPIPLCSSYSLINFNYVFVPDFNKFLCVNTALGADVLIITTAGNCHTIRTEHEDN